MLVIKISTYKTINISTNICRPINRKIEVLHSWAIPQKNDNKRDIYADHSILNFRVGTLMSPLVLHFKRMSKSNNI